MPSPACEVKFAGGAYAPTTNGVDVTAGSTVVIHLIDTSADTWSISCVGTDELSDAATVTASLVIDSVARTATFTAPVAGRAYLFQSKINGGVGPDGKAKSSYTATFTIHTRTSDGLRLIAAGETTESSSSLGWAAKINDQIRNGTTTVADDIAKSAGANIDRVRGIRGVAISGADGAPSEKGAGLVYDGTAYTREKATPVNVFNVRHYAALGNDVDDTAALQAAIDALPNNSGGTIVLPPKADGTPAKYRIKSNIYSRKPLKLIGAQGASGNGLSQITKDPGANIVLLTYGGDPAHGEIAPASDFVIEDLHIEGSGPVTTTVWSPNAVVAAGATVRLYDQNHAYLECIKGGTTSSGVAFSRTLGSRVYQVVAAGPTYTDVTNVAGDAANANFEPFAAGCVAGDYVLFGFHYRFNQLVVDNANGTAGVFGAGASIVWEYYRDDKTWQPLTGVVDGTTGFTAAVGDGKVVSWTMPTDWYHHLAYSADSAPDDTDIFYVRARLSGGTFATRPVLDQAFVGTLDQLPFEPDLSIDFTPNTKYQYGQIVRGHTATPHSSANLITSRLYMVTTPGKGIVGVQSTTEPAWTGAEAIGSTIKDGSNAVTFTVIDPAIVFVPDGTAVWAVKADVGLLIKARGTVRNVTIANVGNAGIMDRADASTGDNANHTRIDHVIIQNCGVGLMLAGSDANVCLVTDVSIQTCGYHLPGNGGVGVHDAGQLNNVFINVEVANDRTLGGGYSFKRFGVGAVPSLFINCYSEASYNSPVVEARFGNKARVDSGNWGGGITYMPSGGPLELDHGDSRGCRNVVALNKGDAVNGTLEAFLGLQDGITACGWKNSNEAAIAGWRFSSSFASWPDKWWMLGRGSNFTYNAFAFPGEGALWPSGAGITDGFVGWIPQYRAHVGVPYYSDPASFGFSQPLAPSESPMVNTSLSGLRWIQGAITVRLDAAIGSPWAWVCTATGTPGTHVPLGIIWDPSIESLTGWWQNYGGASPWAGTASQLASASGGSGGNSATEAVNPPAAGAALNGYGTASFNGTTSKLTLSGTLATYARAPAFSGWALIKATAIASNNATTYNNDAVISTDVSAYFGIFLKSGGGSPTANLYIWDGADKSVSTSFTTGSWQLVQWRINGSWIEIRVNGGQWSRTTAGSINALTSAVKFGANPGGTNFFNGLMAGSGMVPEVWTNEQFDKLRARLSTKFNVSV